MFMPVCNITCRPFLITHILSLFLHWIFVVNVPFSLSLSLSFMISNNTVLISKQLSVNLWWRPSVFLGSRWRFLLDQDQMKMHVEIEWSIIRFHQSFLLFDIVRWKYHGLSINHRSMRFYFLSAGQSDGCFGRSDQSENDSPYKPFL